MRFITPVFLGGGEFTFWHTFSFETGYDGGTLEISTNSGGSWVDLGAFITQGAYNDGNQWTGGSYGTMTEVRVDLSTFPGPVMVGFRFRSDSSVASTGWRLDDVGLQSTLPGDRLVVTPKEAFETSGIDGGPFSPTSKECRIINYTTAPVTLNVGPPHPPTLDDRTPFTASGGLQGGPFAPTSKAYSLTNHTAPDVTWTAQTAAAWLTISPPAGVLSKNQSTSITLSLNAAANNLSWSATPHQAQVIVTNTRDGKSKTIDVELMVGQRPAALDVSLVTSTTLGGGTNVDTIGSGPALTAAARDGAAISSK